MKVIFYRTLMMVTCMILFMLLNMSISSHSYGINYNVITLRFSPAMGVQGATFTTRTPSIYKAFEVIEITTRDTSGREAIIATNYASRSGIARYSVRTSRSTPQGSYSICLRGVITNKKGCGIYRVYARR